jgi:hypothetical protein
MGSIKKKKFFFERLKYVELHYSFNSLIYGMWYKVYN